MRPKAEQFLATLAVNNGAQKGVAKPLCPKDNNGFRVGALSRAQRWYFRGSNSVEVGIPK